MLSCSQTYKDNFASDRYPYKKYTITIGGLSFTNDTIHGESLTLKQSVMDELIEFVGCISSSLSFKITSSALPKADYSGAEVTFTVSSMVSGSYEDLLLFTGYVDSYSTDADGYWQSFVAYDILTYIGDTPVWNYYKKAFKPIAQGGLGSPCTIGDLRRYIIVDCLGLTQAAATLPNDNVKIKKRGRNKDMTALDLLKYICQVNGVWGYIDPSGAFAYKNPTGASTLLGAICNEFKAGEYPCGYTYYDYSGAYSLDWYRDLEYSHSTINPIALGVTFRTSSSDSGVTVDWTNYQNYVTTDWDDDTDDVYIADDDDITESTYIIQANLMAFKLAKRKKLVMGANIMRNLGQHTVFRDFTLKCNGLPFLEPGDTVKAFSKDFPTGMTFLITSRTLKGAQDLEDTYECHPSQEYAEVVSSGSVTVNNQGSYVSDITNNPTTDGTSAVDTALNAKMVMYVESWDSVTGELYTNSVEIEV